MAVASMFQNDSDYYDENMTEDYRCNLPPVVPSSLGIPNAVNIIQGIIAILSALIGLPLLIYLLVIIIKFKHLRQRSLLLILQIIVVEIVYYLVIPLFIFVSAVSGTWQFGDVVCNMAGMINDAFPAVRLYFTLVFTTDRFIFVFWPFLYAKYGTVIAWGLSSSMWVLALLRIIIPMYGALDCYAYIPSFKVCTLFSGCSKSCEIFVTMYLGFVMFTGVFLSAILCIVIIIKVKCVAKQTSTPANLQNTEMVTRNAQQVFTQMHKNKKTLTVLLLIISISCTAPSRVVYILVTLVYQEPNTAVFITNMLVGRTFFNLIPIFDGLALMIHGDIHKVSTKVFKSIKSSIMN